MWVYGNTIAPSPSCSDPYYVTIPESDPQYDDYDIDLSESYENWDAGEYGPYIPPTGAKVWYGAAHSAIVASGNTANPETQPSSAWVRSKWSGGPVVEHYVDDCPYWALRDLTNVKVYVAPS